MKALVLTIACFLPLPLMAQNPGQPIHRQVIRPPGAQQPPVPVMQQSPTEDAALNGNIVIRIQGNTTTGSDIDLSLTGVGPRFTVDQAIDENTSISCEYVVSETEKGYKVSYSVSTRIKVSTSTTPNPNNVQYRDIATSGTVLCVANRPVTLVRNGAKPMKLTISKEAEQQDGAANPAKAGG